MSTASQTSRKTFSPDQMLLVARINEAVVKDPVLQARFWAKVEKTEGCWVWKAAVNNQGYGVFGVGSSKTYLAHRISYVVANGVIPDGLELDHLCRNTLCVRPPHLEPTTHRENILRGEGPSAKEALQTHCKNGHLLSPGNLVLNRLARGRRLCRECTNQYQKDYYKRRHPN